MRRRAAALILALVSSSGLAFAQEPIDWQVVTAIRAEGLNRSQVMETLSYLTDVHGPRLTGSPDIRNASQWSREKLAEWGLVKAELEPWGEFGVGWSLRNFSIQMVEPKFSPIIAYPKAWTEGTKGTVKGRPVLVEASNVDELQRYKGTLKGAIVMLPLTREAETHFEADAKRYTDDELAELALAPEPGGRRGPSEERRAQYRRMREVREKMDEFFREEGVRVTLEASRGEHGTLFVGSGGSYAKDGRRGLPSLVVAVEAYARILRLMEKKIPVQLEVSVDVEFHDEDLQGYNVVAEIPGSDPQLKDEIVMLGGHIDSWHAGTGAADDAAGVAVAMEAVRIIKALGLKPRRTIRIALWSGEEQGLLGSRGYVAKHFGDPRSMELLPEHDRLSGYFNLDNGTGKIRGVYLQGNSAVRPIFQAYLEPFHDMGANTLTIRDTGGTDHLSFDAVGLPGFQFIQDDIDYDTRTHHTNMDVWDHALEPDLMQASVIMASFVYHTAMRDEKLPREPLPAPRSEGRGGPPTAGRP